MSTRNFGEGGEGGERGNLKGEREREENYFDFNSLRGGHFFTEIELFMQLDLRNTHTNCQVSICKTLDLTNKKPILIA
jgi:hypothetical protein